MQKNLGFLYCFPPIREFEINLVVRLKKPTLSSRTESISNIVRGYLGLEEVVPFFVWLGLNWELIFRSYYLFF